MTLNILRRKLFCLLPMLFIWIGAGAQDFAIKSNMLGDTMGSLNVAIEGRISNSMTIDVQGNLDPWTRKGESLTRHLFVQPEVRFWTCDAFSGHFLALHLHSGIFNVGGIESVVSRFLTNDFSLLRNSRYQGWFSGAGVSYGYDLILGRNINLEFEIGGGYAYTKYDQFECNVCGDTLAENMTHHYWGITKAAVNLVFLF